jgi:hypothetical protein
VSSHRRREPGRARAHHQVRVEREESHDSASCGVEMEAHRRSSITAFATERRKRGGRSSPRGLPPDQPRFPARTDAASGSSLDGAPARRSVELVRVFSSRMATRFMSLIMT